ncbi:prephenate dehydratase [Aureibacillus halotolerans]|uniref:Prephenate dehydratase n=1 Tax=Aureibacillus halotolerans TaxID=1508390 RepID=A0A4R6U4M3_9BACI|nr:prephenate dehydratase [Aureibacillus halotolerans]TDQ37974.1 prephenate dehydratase [Aureibacillus halotolerans]
MSKIGYLGPKGTFSSEAVSLAFTAGEPVPYSTIPACIEAVSSGEVDYGVVPLENTLEGSVNLTIDYLIHEKTLPIVGEVIVPIQQHLLVHADFATDWRSTVTKVISHPHALAQCYQFLRNELPNAEMETMSSTAAAAQYIAEKKDPSLAAIAHHNAAKEFSLVLAKENIHDFANNHTRFLILHRQGKSIKMDTERFKTTFHIALPQDKPGSLHQVLSAFSWRQLNLSKIESRPMKTGLGRYFFIIDIDHPLDEVLLPGAQAELEALGCQVRILGSYPSFEAIATKTTSGI